MKMNRRKFFGSLLGASVLAPKVLAASPAPPAATTKLIASCGAVQILKSTRFQVEEIARLYQVPMRLLVGEEARR